MRKIATGTLIAGAAAAATVALGATPAFAAGFTVTNGGPFTSTSTNVHFTDVNSGAVFNCTSSSVPGNAPNGTGLPGTGIATLSNGTFSGCTGTGGSSGTATLTSGSLDAASTSGGVTIGTISGVNATLHISDLLGSCTATVSGGLGANNVTYNNNGTLTIAADAARPTALKIISASGTGCAGLINTNDTTTFSATFAVSPAPQISATP
jgi:hypothetical protein